MNYRSLTIHACILLTVAICLFNSSCKKRQFHTELKEPANIKDIPIFNSGSLDSFLNSKTKIVSLMTPDINKEKISKIDSLLKNNENKKVFYTDISDSEVVFSYKYDRCLSPPCPTNDINYLLFARPLAFGYDYDNFRIQSPRLSIYNSMPYYPSDYYHFILIYGDSVSIYGQKLDFRIGPCFFKGPLEINYCHLGSDFKIDNCTFQDKLSIVNNLDRQPIKVLGITNSSIKKGLAIGGERPHQLHFFYQDTMFYSLEFLNDSISGTIDLSNTFFPANSTIYYDNSTLPDTLNFDGTTFTNSIDLTHVLPNSNERKCQLILSPSAADNFNIQYQYFELAFAGNQKYDPSYRDYVASIYERLLKNLSNKGYNISRELLDIDYKEWQENYNWTLIFSDYWWQFGYRKSRIIWWTLGLMAFFSIINRYLFPKLQHEYPTENLKNKFYDYWQPKSKVVLEVNRLAVSVLYTGLIFFKLSVDFQKMKFDKMGFALFILFQYTIGLVCTGFLINWILKG